MPTLALTKLVEQVLRKDIPALYSTEDVPVGQKEIRAKLFALASAATWYIAEASAQIWVDGEIAYVPLNEVKDPGEIVNIIMFGYADLHGQGYAAGAEWGYIPLEELSELRWCGVPRVELDAWFTPIKFDELIDEEGKLRCQKN